MQRSGVHDDRGRRIRVITPGWRVLLPFPVPGRGDGAVRARAAAALPSKFAWSLRAKLLYSSVIGFFGALSIYYAMRAGTAFTRWYTWSPVLSIAFAAVMAWSILRQVRYHDKLVASTLLKAELCPACGYSLSAIPAESDQCTVCPECGAAWKRQA